jgi:hypothetical protein
MNKRGGGGGGSSVAAGVHHIPGTWNDDAEDAADDERSDFEGTALASGGGATSVRELGQRVTSTLVAEMERLAVVNYAAPFRRMYSAYEAEARADLDARLPRTRLSFVCDPIESAERRAATSGSVSGRERLILLQQTLDAFGLTRSPNQRM